MKLKIKLRDGFKDDHVSIKVDGHEVYSKSGVSTDLSISFADAVEIPVKDPSVKLNVTVDGKTEEKEIRVDKTPFVDVWREGPSMELRESPNEVPVL
jgi:hypothetical protein